MAAFIQERKVPKYQPFTGAAALFEWAVSLLAASKRGAVKSMSNICHNILGKKALDPWISNRPGAAFHKKFSQFLHAFSPAMRYIIEAEIRHIFRRKSVRNLVYCRHLKGRCNK